MEELLVVCHTILEMDRVDDQATKRRDVVKIDLKDEEITILEKRRGASHSFDNLKIHLF